MRYKDLPYEEKKKIVSLVFEEASKMKKLRRTINYRELSRIVFAKTNVHLGHCVIRDWLIKQCRPMGNYKAVRRPPKEDGQIIRGLSITDLHITERHHTIYLWLYTTKDFYAVTVQSLLARHGHVSINPVLTNDVPEWRVIALFDRGSWTYELRKPIERLTEDEKLKLLSGAVSGDGWITVDTCQRRRVRFRIGLVSTERRKAEIYQRILTSLSIPCSFTKEQVQSKQSNIGNLIIQSKAPYRYKVRISARKSVTYLLNNLKLVHPYKEVRRVIALRFLKESIIDPAAVKLVWDWLRVVEKYSTIRSQIRACELIPDEKFDKKHLNKQWIIKQLHKRLYEYADRVMELKPVATRIISDLRHPSTSSFSFGSAA